MNTVAPFFTDWRTEMVMSNQQKEHPSRRPQTRQMGYRIAVALALGAGIALVLDNLAMGVAIGVAIGTALGAAQTQKK